MAEPHVGTFRAAVRLDLGQQDEVPVSGMMPSSPKSGAPPGGEVGAALRECRSAFAGVAAFSAAVNVLMLAGPRYMLLSSDRVLSCRSVPTLVALSVFRTGS